MNKTIVIPAAGLGSRLGSFTKNYSKAMCTLGKMPVISHIINQFSNDDEIIILLGYKGDLLRQVVETCHPNKNITFVDVDVFEGPDSGLGYSLHCAYDLLQKPFIFWSCDTVLPDFNINDKDYTYNWAVVSNQHKEYFEGYRHMKLNESNDVVSILPKDIPYENSIYSYVGVSFIYDYKVFWEAYFNNKETFISSGETYGLVNLHHLKGYVANNWIDTGNRNIFEYYKNEYSSKMEETVLEKPDEAIWFIDNNVIKFHIDPKFIADRVKRFNTMLCDKQLSNGIKLPKLLNHSNNTYSYKRADGVIASKVITRDMIKDILNKFMDVDEVNIDDETKHAIYEDFYKNKTLSRIEKYCNEYEDVDDSCLINGMDCLTAKYLINKINWTELSKTGVFTNNYHGDFHLENILVNKGTYTMLDWRQNFGKTYVGDVYYDIAKMWHSLIVNHNMVRDNHFNVTNTGKKEISIDIYRTFIDTECEDALKEYLNESKYDIRIAELLTAVIFLNIAACHVYPYSKFLFYLGKYMINKIFRKYPEFFNN